MKDYYLVFNGTPRGPFSLQDLQAQTILLETFLWKEGWPDWMQAANAAQLYPELQAVIGKAVVASDSAEQAGYADSISVIDRIYQRIAALIDRKLKANQHQLDSHIFYRLLYRWRERYLHLSESKQFSFRLLLSSLLLLVSVWMAFSSFSWGWLAAKIWISFVALNSVPAISHILDEMHHATINYLLMVLPRFIRRFIARNSKTVVTLIIAYCVSSFIAPFYLLYQMVLLFVPVRSVEPTHSESLN
jgi:hypothetical protein